MAKYPGDLKLQPGRNANLWLRLILPTAQVLSIELHRSLGRVLALLVQARLQDDPRDEDYGKRSYASLIAMIARQTGYLLNDETITAYLTRLWTKVQREARAQGVALEPMLKRKHRAVLLALEYHIEASKDVRRELFDQGEPDSDQ